MVRALLLLILPVGLLAVPRSADACSCVSTSSCQRYASSPAVFAADVVDVVQGPTGPKTVRMRVVRSYKGTAKAGEEVTVRMPRGTSASCSLDARPGDRYVIHAGAGADGFSTSLCQGSYGLKKEDPLPDLPPPAGQVTGVLNRYRMGAPRGQEWIPIADVLVYVVTPDGRIEARTDAAGRFTMTGVPLGPRMVRSDVAPGERVEERIDLQFKGDCAEVFGTPSPTGRLIGAVLDHTGKPIKGADVSVIPVASPNVHGRGTETGPSGAFSISGLEPGSYHVSVGGIGVPTNRYPYVRVFHPGVADRQTAQVVTIGADTVRLPATRLLPPIELVPIVADIVCRDGTVPGSAFLSAEQLPIAEDRYGHKDFGSMASREGRSTIRVVAGHRYLVRGEITVKEPMPEGGYGTYSLSTEPVDVDPAAPPPRLILRSPLEKCGDADGVTVPARR